MKYSVLVLILVLAAGSCLTIYPQAQPQKPPSPPVQQEEPPPVFAVPSAYKYDQHGRRDPFVNPVPKPVARGPSVETRPRPPGLKGVLIAEANIVGVVVSKEPSMNVVVITAPGGRTYFGHPGDALFDAIIKDISAVEVTFTVTAPGGGKPETAREPIVRKVRPPPGENK